MSRPRLSLWIGYDPREYAAFAVARYSAELHCTNKALRARGLVLSDLQQRGLYRRPIEMRPGVDRPVMYDVLSERPMSTQHANARFLIKELAGTGWALFCDGDVLFRGNVMKLFEGLSPSYAAYCVKHDYAPREGVKMDGQINQAYPKKNWSSVFALNCDHPSNNKLTLDLINSVPGRDLHRFCWLDDDEIGSLSPQWNYLVGESPKCDDVKIAHFTLGVPDMLGYEQCELADEWRLMRERSAA